MFLWSRFVLYEIVGILFAFLQYLWDRVHVFQCLWDHVCVFSWHSLYGGLSGCDHTSAQIRFLGVWYTELVHIFFLFHDAYISMLACPRHGMYV